MDYLCDIISFIKQRYPFVCNTNQSFFDILKTRKKDLRLCIWGAGAFGKAMVSLLKKFDVNIECFCDNNKNLHGKIIDDIPCLSPQELTKYKDHVTVFICADAIDTIYAELVELGISDIVRHPECYIQEYRNISGMPEKDLIYYIKELFQILADEQSRKVAYYKIKAFFSNLKELNEFSYQEVKTSDEYFPKDIIGSITNCSFIDCGAYDGDTLRTFLQYYGENSLNKYTAFELDQVNYTRLCENCSCLPPSVQNKLCLKNIGISNCRESLAYSQNDYGSVIEREGNYLAEIDTLDHCIPSDEKVTYVKMDIEGSEVDALNGAHETLRRCQPTLAVCVYHKFSHLWEIPLLIHKILPEHRIYLRHHSTLVCDTVCYAVK